jgi:iron complex transport system ATP-binding protein
MSAPEILIRGLTVRLGRREALSGLDLSFRPGELGVVVGPNGAGKTTLLRAIAGLVPPSAGSVALGSEPVGEMSRAARARRIAYLPQIGGISWPLPVRDVAALGRLPHGEAPDRLPPEGERAVADAIAAVGLRGFEARPVTELSGGERARALLARALATKAPVLLVDEPVAALDPRHQLLVLDVLRRQARAGGVVVAVMHDLALASRFADGIVLLDRGRAVAAGAPGEVLTAARLEAVFGIEAVVCAGEDGLAITARRALPATDDPLHPDRAEASLR